MESCFFEQNKELWGFNMNLEGEMVDEISMMYGEIVKRIVEGALCLGLELHVLPKASIPFVMVRTPSNMWHYFLSEEEARTFQKNIMVDGYKACWQFI